MQGLASIMAKLQAIPGAVQANLEASALKSGTLIQAEAKRLCPVKSGTLRRSIHTKIVRQGAWRIVATVGTDVEYAFFVEHGTPPHIIRPGPGKKALAWPGGRHPVKYVRHPGTMARPFLRPALDAHAQGAVSAFGGALWGAIKGAVS